MTIKVTVILSPTLLSSAHMIKAIAVQSTILVWGRSSGYSNSMSIAGGILLDVFGVDPCPMVRRTLLLS